MITHSIIQGTPDWHLFRAEHFGASEASAMLGLSPYKTRTQLLNEKKTGLVPEVDAFPQKIFDNGHAVEKLALPIVEKMIGEDLSPVTCSNGKLSASCDGLTLMGDVAWENKQFNAAHYEQVKNGELPEIHWPQCQQVMHVTGAKKLFFTISDGTEERTVGVWVYPVVELIKVITAGWDQFEKDLAVHEVAETKQAPKAQAIIALPALAIQIKGEVTLSNLPEFKQAATAFISTISTELLTDEDFANAEANAKFCKDAEDNIEQTKKSAIAQTASIDELMRTMDFIKDQLRDKRLLLERLVKSEKENRKLQIIKSAQDELGKHFTALSAEIKPVVMIVQPTDFSIAIKGKKTITGMQEAVNQLLADSKINLDATARDIRTKQAWLKENADGYQFLFADIQTVIYKPMDDMQMLVKSRIAEHKQAEAEKEAAIKAKAEADALAKVEAERKEADVKALLASQQADHERQLAESKELVPVINDTFNEADFQREIVNTGTGVVQVSVSDTGEITKQVIPTSYFYGTEPTVNEIVSALAAAFKVDELQAHKWLISCDFTKYQPVKIAA